MPPKYWIYTCIQKLIALLATNRIDNVHTVMPWIVFVMQATLELAVWNVFFNKMFTHFRYDGTHIVSYDSAYILLAFQYAIYVSYTELLFSVSYKNII